APEGGHESHDPHAEMIPATGHQDHSGHGVDHGAVATEPAHLGHDHQEQGHGHGAADGIEWEDDMVEVNRLTTTANMVWKFVDRTPGAAGTGIDWRFQVGDRVKIRLVNEMDS